MDRYRKRVFLLIGIVFSLALVHAQPVMAMSDTDIEQRIEQEATANPRLRETMVTVDVVKGFVVLRGKVNAYIQKMLYEQIAWKTMGVVEVENEIRIVPALPATDNAIKRRILEVVHTRDDVADIDVSVTVESGVVYVRGVFHDPHDVQILKHRIAEIQGVVGIDIQAEFLL